MPSELPPVFSTKGHRSMTTASGGAINGPMQTPPVIGEGAQTIDDLMASVVAIAGPNGQPNMTGFVLAQPHLIVTDGYLENTRFIHDRVTVVAFGNRRFDTKVVRHIQYDPTTSQNDLIVQRMFPLRPTTPKIKSYPFGPLILAVPEELKVPGLRLDTGSLEPNLAVHIGVAAGERVGVSSGLIEDPTEKRLQIAPIGDVDYMVEVQCVVAPGASGAPVVDSSFAVRGFIVAGSTDPGHPLSYMYPSNRWANLLEAKLPEVETLRRSSKRGRKNKKTQ